MEKHEVLAKNFVVYSSSIDRIVVYRSWFSTHRKVNKNLLIQTLEKITVEGFGEVEPLAEKEQGGMNKLCTSKLRQVPEG